MKLKIIIINVIFPLVFGVIIYVIFRDDSIRLFEWLNNLGFVNTIDSIKETTAILKNHTPAWVYYSLPDGLWIYSLTSAFLLIWNPIYGIKKILALIPLIFGLMIELAQEKKIINGTFDFQDVSFLILFFLLSLIIITFEIRKYENKID